MADHTLGVKEWVRDLEITEKSKWHRCPVSFEITPTATFMN